MRLVDAPVGAVLRDKDGDLWERTSDGVDLLLANEWYSLDIAETESRYGPFELAGAPAAILRDLRDALTAAIEALAGPRDSARDLEVVGRAQAALAAADRLEP